MPAGSVLGDARNGLDAGAGAEIRLERITLDRDR